ncbi:OapA family protein [Marinobacter sp. C2H3]|uniref:OapA family protein n=1 Tax=Marinobacter sp. C2H3 TaxID=3119003 RepID=UPI00300EAA3A
MFKTFPKMHIALAGVSGAVVAAAILMGPSASVEAKRMTYPIATQNTDGGKVAEEDKQPQQDALAASNAPTPAAEPGETTPPAPALRWQSFSVKSGDTLSSLFSAAGFDDATMLTVIHGEGDAAKLQNLFAGETLRFATADDGQLAAVELQRNRLESLRVTAGKDGQFEGHRVVREPEARPAFASGTIDGSLYSAALKAGLDDRLTMSLIELFGWDIDFVYDVRKGDRFEVVYEELYLDGERLGTGRLLSARFVNRGEPRVAVSFTDQAGNTDFYTPAGKSMRKAILRTPIDARVSSPFNLQRRHPVLDVVRPHEGTDYAAAPGTPIKAAGTGRVLSAGWKGGYGRAVVLQHGDGITTLYAHMSRIGKGVRAGARVKQGQTIGYVGSSGMVTGPHLHYEYRKNGRPVNSRTVTLPDAKPVPAAEMAQFRQVAERQVAQLDRFDRQHQQLALANEE